MTPSATPPNRAIHRTSIPRTVAILIASACIVASCHPGDDKDAAAAVAATAPASESVPPGVPGPDELAHEIDRVVKDLEVLPAWPDDLPRQIRATFRCADFLTHLRYCMSFGWTESTERETQADALAGIRAERARTGKVQETGDLSLASQLDIALAMTPQAWAREVRSEFEDAASGFDGAMAYQPTSAP